MRPRLRTHRRSVQRRSPAGWAMIEFDIIVRIGRTPAQVFSVLADFQVYLARWAKGPVAAVRTDGDGRAGSHYTITARAGALPGGVPPDRGGSRDAPHPVDPGHAPRPVPAGLLRGRLQQLIASDLDRLKDLIET